MPDKPLLRRRLGTSGLEITTVGLGSWAVGGDGWAGAWGSQDDAESLAALHRGVELGINWIDTAPVYGLGHAEEVVGRFLREVDPALRPLVFTKCGLVWDEADRQKPSRRDLTPASIRREALASLRRLGVEWLDLLQFHWPDNIGTAAEDSWGAVLRLVEEGLVRFAGVSNYDASLLDRSEAVGHVTSLQPPFSLIRRDAAAAEIPWAERHGTGVLVYSPMQAGLLTDGFDATRAKALGGDDWRSRSPEFQSPRLERNLSLRDALAPVATRHGATVAAVAVAWTLSWNGVTAAIVGARRASQVDGWIQAGSLELGTEDLAEIASAIERTGAGTGPARPETTLI
jgi:aryl-alcohol dehydrogenase-like predicted oxidoreductase